MLSEKEADTLGDASAKRNFVAAGAAGGEGATWQVFRPLAPLDATLPDEPASLDDLRVKERLKARWRELRAEVSPL